MIKYYLRRQLDKFERENNYDTTYARELLDASPVLVFLMFLTDALARRPRQISLDAWFAAKAAAVLEADCGPCAQLGITLATRQGVPPSTIRALVTGDYDAAPEEARLAFLYVRHSLRRTPEAETYRTQLLSLYGPRPLARLAYAVTLTHSYPTLKSLLGPARSCTRLRIGTETLPVHHDAPHYAHASVAATPRVARLPTGSETTQLR